MKKRTRIFAIYAAVPVAIVAIVAIALFVIPKASDIFRSRAYVTKAPTREKIKMLAEWLPADRDFYLAMDVPKALGSGPISEKIAAIASGREGVAAELIRSLLANQSALGMLAVAGELGDLGEKSDVVILAQGNFDEKTIVPAIRAAMTEGRAGLAAQNLTWTTLYFESDSRDPFGFMLLDKRHLAAGRRDSLLSFYETRPDKPSAGGIVASDDVFSGYVAIGERMKGSAPKEIYLPDGAFIRSSDGVQLSITIPCNDPAKAQGVVMFLEGLRSLVAIQEKEAGETGLASVVKGISVSVEGGDVVLKGEIMPLISLWAQSPAKEAPPTGEARPQNPQAPKAPQQ